MVMLVEEDLISNTFYDNLLQRPMLHDIVKVFLGTIHGIEYNLH